MPEFLRRLFSVEGFMPHGHCYLWEPEIVWLHAVSDGLIAASYMTIPITLTYFIRRRRDLPFPFVFWAFGAFIVSCGMTHVMEVWTIWTPTYRLSGVIKAVTAVASVATAVLLVRLIPRALKIPSSQSFKEAHDLLAIGEARFRAATEGMRDAFYIFESVREAGRIVDFRLVEVNSAGAARLGKRRDEITGVLYSKMYAPARRSGIMDRFVRVATTGEPYEGEIEVKDEAIAAKWVHLLVVPLHNGVAITSSDITERRRVERERELHMAVVKNMSDGICLVRVSDAVIVYTNPKFDKMLGYEPGELPGKPVAIVNDAKSDEDAQMVAQRLMKTIREEGEATYEVRNVRKDGRRITCEATASIIRAEDQGELIVAVQGDITERKRTQEERDGFFRLSLDMLCIAGFDGRFRRLNPAWEATLGWSLEELLSRPWLDFVHPEDRARTIAEGGKIVDGALTLSFENRYQCKNGEYRTLSWRAVPSLPDEVIFASVRDVTELRSTEEELRKSVEERENLLKQVHLHRQEEHLRLLAESIPQIVWTANPDGWLDYYNRAWFDYTGMTLEETQGWGWEPVLHPDDLQNCVSRWTESVQTGKNYEVEYRFKRASDGQYRWHLGRARPVRDFAGRIVKWFGTCTDIDDQRRAQEALRESQHQLEMRVAERTTQLSSLNETLEMSLREKEVLLKEIHHRVKNNLQVISSLLKLQSEQISDESTKNLFKDSRGRVRSIALLHEKLYGSRDLARIDMDVYVRDLTHSILRSHGAVARQVELSTDAVGVSLGIDLAMPCGLIINELVTNALKYAFKDRASRGLVSVRMTQTGDRVELVVADDGSGLPPTLDLARSKTMGLHLVTTLSEQLDATIRFESVEGTRFVIGFSAPAASGSL